MPRPQEPSEAEQVRQVAEGLHRLGYKPLSGNSVVGTADRDAVAGPALARRDRTRLGSATVLSRATPRSSRHAGHDRTKRQIEGYESSAA